MILDAIGLALGAGLAITVGAAIASFEHIRPKWLEQEFRHFVIAFGGGALLSAIALVLVPDGIKYQPPATAVLSFLAGGAAFMGLDIWLSKRKSQASQLLAMMLDFVPEAMVLGAIIATDRSKPCLSPLSLPRRTCRKASTPIARCARGASLKAKDCSNGFLCWG